MNTDRHLIAEVERLRDENAVLSEALETIRKGYAAFELPDGGSARLTYTERAILKLLYDRCGRLCGRQALWEMMYAVRPTKDIPSVKIIDVMICKIRRKLVGWRITTVWGTGYILERVDA